MGVDETEKRAETPTNPRRVYRCEETPEALRRMLLEGLDRLIASPPAEEER